MGLGRWTKGMPRSSSSQPRPDGDGDGHGKGGAKLGMPAVVGTIPSQCDILDCPGEKKKIKTVRAETPDSAATSCGLGLVEAKANISRMGDTTRV